MDETAFLARFRRDPLLGERAAHPGRFAPPTSYAPTWEAFAAVLSNVGGSMLAPTPDWRTALQSAIDLDDGPVVAASAAHPFLIGINGWSVAGNPGAPHAWEGVGLGILVGDMAVAENGAVLLTSRLLPERALAVLAQRLLLLVPRSVLVGDFITAQRRLAERPVDDSEHHLTWMSGPSKTADIEQCLVIGAHGARALTVLVVDTPTGSPGAPEQ